MDLDSDFKGCDTDGFYLLGFLVLRRFFHFESLSENCIFAQLKITGNE